MDGDRLDFLRPGARGVRPSVWLLVGASLLAVAAVLVVTLYVGVSPRAARLPAPLAGSGVAAASPAPAEISDPIPEAGPALERAEASPAPGPGGGGPPRAPGSVSTAGPAPEVTTLDAQAARLVEQLGPIEPDLPPVVAAALTPPPLTGSPEAQLRSAADEVLVQYLLDGTFAGQVYPWGFPIETVVQQQRSVVGGLSPEQRAEQLELALRFWTPRRPVPQFADPAQGGDVWEGGGMDRWLLQGSTQSPR